MTDLGIARAKARAVEIEAKARARASAPAADLEQDHRAWLHTMFPADFRGIDQFAPHHDEYWSHVWNLSPDEKPPAFFAVWNRGGMKSTAAEATGCVLAALGKRTFGVYVSGTQDKADGHLESVKDMLASSNLGNFYPQLAKAEVKMVSDRKIPGAWNHAELNTAGGLSMIAAGLNKSIRGLKKGSQRPDFFILDDIEDEDDSPLVVQKKIERLKTAILPAGAQNCAVFFVQNLIHRDSVISQCLDGRAEMLLERLVSGPIPAIRNAEYREEGTGTNKRYFIIGGQNTWVGMDVKACEKTLNEVGKPAWETEYQHNTDQAYKGAVFPGFDPVYHVITRSEFAKVYEEFGAAVAGDGMLRLPDRGYCNVSQDVGTTPGHPCVTLWNWRPGEWMPNTDSIFLTSELCRPHFPPRKEREVVSPIGIGKEIQDREKNWGVEIQWRQGSHEAAAVRNTYADLGQIPGYKAMFFSPIKTADGAKGIAAIQDLLEIDFELIHPFRVYPIGHPKAGQPLRGRPQFYLVVADGQGELYFNIAAGKLKAMEAFDEEGFARTRFEFPRLRYLENAQGAEASKPFKMDDDAMDALKAAVARCKPHIQALSKEEKARLRYAEQVKVIQSSPMDAASKVYAEMTAAYHQRVEMKRASQPLRYGMGASEFEDGFSNQENEDFDDEGVPDWFE